MVYREPGFQFRDGAGNEYELVQAYSDGVTILGQWKQDGGLRIIRVGEHIQEILLAPGAQPLGLSELPILKILNSPKELRGKKGANGISSRGRKMVVCGCHELEAAYGKDCLSFLTVTLPNLSHDDLQACEQRWDYLTHRLFMYIRSQCDKRNIEFEYVAATEVQEGREENRGEYALHLHLVYRGRAGKKKPWVCTPGAIRRAWSRAISSVVGHREFATTALENLVRLRKSAGRYMSKYLSKGIRSRSDRTGNGRQGSPGRHWYSVARRISQRVHAKIIKIASPARTPDNYQTLELLHLCRDGGIAVLHRFTINGDGSSCGRAYAPIGYAGFFRGTLYPLTRDTLSDIFAKCKK